MSWFQICRRSLYPGRSGQFLHHRFRLHHRARSHSLVSGWAAAVALTSARAFQAFDGLAHRRIEARAAFVQMREDRRASKAAAARPPPAPCRSHLLIEHDQERRWSDRVFLFFAAVRFLLLAEFAGSLATADGCSRILASWRASASNAVISGVVGSRSGTTRPTAWVTRGATIGIERTLSVRPNVS